MHKVNFHSILIASLLLAACKGKVQTEEHIQHVNIEEIVEHVEDTVQKPEIKSELTPAADSIYGDTVWVYPYGIKHWSDTMVGRDFGVYMSVWVDTTDYLIDTVKSKKGSRIVIGYNHYYKLEFSRGNKHWFTSAFNKRENLANLLEGSEYWLESNLDVFQQVFYNPVFDKFIVEFDINPRYNYGSVYYLVIDNNGKINHVGLSGSWGGGGPDGDSFLASDMSSFVSCYEVYNFKYNTAISIAEYVMLAENRLTGETAPIYRQVHALRRLDEDRFLVVFNKYKGNPELNGLILKMDTTILQRFRYYGLMEEIDAMLLFANKPDINRLFLYDTEREVLICFGGRDSITLNEFLMRDIRPISSDSVLARQYIEIDFEAFGAYRFLIDSAAKEVFRENENTN